LSCQHGCFMGAQKQEARLLGYSIFCWAMAVVVSLPFLFYLMGCVKTVSQKATPSREPAALIASEIEPEGFVESTQPIITVHYPADLAVMEFDLLSISLSLP
jgi:hypothetical protein